MNALNQEDKYLMFALIAAAALVAGCSGGGGNMNSASTAQAPQILGLSSVNVNQDTTSAPLAFRVLDTDTPATALTVDASSSDTTLLPLAGIVVAGTGSERRISITPAAEAVGAATVTLSVRDPSGLVTSAALPVRVNPVLVSFKSLTNDSFAMTEAGELAKVSGVTVQPDADDDPNAFDALLQ